MEINLVDLQLKQKELIKEREKLTENYERELSDINAELRKTTYYQNLLLNNFDADKIANAKKYIYTEGVKKYFRGDSEAKLIEAIEDVATGFKIMKKEYLGCKDYDRWSGQGIREHRNRCHGMEDPSLEGSRERIEQDLKTAEDALKYLTRKEQGEPDRLIKILCSCGNEVKIPINEEDRCHRIENQSGKFEFTHVYNGNAGLICSKCGNKLVWY